MTDNLRDTRPRVSLVAPVHNEAECLPRLVEEATAALEAIEGGYEILLVDDGSEDGSGALIEELAVRHRTIRPLRRRARGGQSAAVLAGIQAARGEIVVTIDSDLQNDPADIPRLLEHLVDFDLVGGIRVDRQDAWHRRAASRFANSFRRLVLGDSFRDVGCSLKAYRATFLGDLPPFDGLHRFLPVIVEHRGARVKEVPVRHRPRRFGESKYNVGGRALRGVVDLLAVRWLRRRAISPSAAEEVRPAQRPESATTAEAKPPEPQGSSADARPLGEPAAADPPSTEVALALDQASRRR